MSVKNLAVFVNKFVWHTHIHRSELRTD